MHCETYVVQIALLLIKIFLVSILEHDLLFCVTGSQRLGQQHAKMRGRNRKVGDRVSSGMKCAVMRKAGPHMENADSIQTHKA